MIRCVQKVCMGLLFLLCVSENSYPQAIPVIGDATAIAAQATPEIIKLMGYMSRLEPSIRDDRLHELANYMNALNQVDRDKLKKLQEAFQESLLQFTGDKIISDLDRMWVEEIDNALEAVFTLDDIRKGYEWNSLVYVYGYFNHDITVKEIQDIANEWYHMPEEEKAKQFPTYIHLIDAVVKPLAYWEQPVLSETLDRLEVGVSLLANILKQEPAPGTAFHAPSHGLIISAAMYNRFQNKTMYSSRLTKNIGVKAVYGELLNSLSIGAHPDPGSIEKDLYRFYMVREYYAANALARLNWRFNGVTSDILRKSLEIYEKQGGAEKTIHAVHRCMVALKDANARKEFESNLDNRIEDLVWIINNGKDEAVDYATIMLAKAMNCPVDKAVELYYKQIISDLTRKVNESNTTGGKE